ncbi:MAG: choice-of-anchor B family protein [Crocinitomicaceae bacterium]|nr:choice-of-anchor B family protein [Crocinitomicaceae bacterium]
MKQVITLFVFLFSLVGFSQLNMTQLGYLDIPTIHTTSLNGVWGYTDENGNEYALVGTRDGVSIVDITNAASPNELVFIPGANSIWREIKTNGDYAYVTTEAEEGLLIIDLSPLPGSTTLPTNYYTGPVGNSWNTAHSLYATDGYVYINGAGRGNGGLIILDVATDPMNPIEVGDFDTWYVHDCFVRDDTAYCANIYDGFFSVLDVTNKSNPILLGTAITPTNFSHNIWTSTDGNYAFTTDEVSGGFIGAYDVSDPSNIIYLDKIQSSPGAGIVPHNAHVLGNYLVTSYYADGVVIHDITYPNNLIQVGNHDTNPHELTNTSGCWSVYPYFPSGNIIATDIEEGLYIFDVNYLPGAYLEGTVTEMGTGNPINNVTVTIDGEEITDYSGVLGDYATGIANAGMYDVTYFKVLYYPQTISTTLTNGAIEIQDVVLEKIPQFNLTVEVLDATTLNPIENANVKLQHTYISHEGTTDANGLVTLGLYYQDNYDLYGGKWGFETSCFVDTLILNSSGTVTLYINQGYYDDFTFDYGWISDGDAEKGFFEREIPVGASNPAGTIVQNPYNDVPWDCGDYAYMTGNGSSSSNTDEVNGGEVVLISPVFDLTTYSDPHINYASWFYCQFGYEPVNDTLKFFLFDGTTTVLIDKKFDTNTNMSHWVPNSIRIADFIVPGTSMQLILTISDELETVNLTEGGIDHFSITDFSLAAVQEESGSPISVYPNPANDLLYLKGISEGFIMITDLSGRLVLESTVQNDTDISILASGIYVIQISDQTGQIIHTEKLIVE